jgi:hypothetical protein
MAPWFASGVWRGAQYAVSPDTVQRHAQQNRPNLSKELEPADGGLFH